MEPSGEGTRLDSAYRQHFGRLMRVAYVMTGSNAIAEDLVHDVFLRCANRLDDVDDAASYLRAAVVNACRKDFRRRSRLGPLAGDEPGGAEPHRVDVDLQRALAALAPRKRAAVVLRFLEDLPFDEVAAALDCRPATARSLVRRAMDEMKEVLDER